MSNRAIEYVISDIALSQSFFTLNNIISSRSPFIVIVHTMANIPDRINAVIRDKSATFANFLNL